MKHITSDLTQKFVGSFKGERYKCLYNALWYYNKQIKCQLLSFFVSKGWTAWQRRFALRAILDATEVFFAFLISVTYNSLSVLYYKLNPASYAVVSPASPQSFYHNNLCQLLLACGGEP